MKQRNVSGTLRNIKLKNKLGLDKHPVSHLSHVEIGQFSLLVTFFLGVIS